MSRVVIVLEGGLVDGVYSDDPEVQVAVLDRDVFDDMEPKFDMDNFFQPEVDSDLSVYRQWQERKARYYEGRQPEDEA